MLSLPDPHPPRTQASGRALAESGWPSTGPFPCCPPPLPLLHPLPPRPTPTPLQVRIIDKRFRGGRLYLKKGTVVDVHPGGVCDVAMDEGKEMVQVGLRAEQADAGKVVDAGLGGCGPEAGPRLAPRWVGRWRRGPAAFASMPHPGWQARRSWNPLGWAGPVVKGHLRSSHAPSAC